MDLHALQKRQAFRPVAPSNISKEHQGIWDAWSIKSDREVAREAAAKGHVSLAIQFMSARKSIRQDQAKDFINSEVFKWVAELLDRKQIFRVSHILTNVGIDPGPELITVFCNTDKKYLRDYIGEYLTKTGQLTSELLDLSYFLDVISKNNLLTVSNRLKQDSVRCLQETSDSWKHEVAGKLFLINQDYQLMPFLDAEIMWKLLLLHNNLDLLKLWITVSFSSEPRQDKLSLSGDFLKIFQLFPVTDEMLDGVLNYDCSPETQDEILNEFCKYGKFSNHDLTSVVNVLKRISQSDNISNIYTILDQTHSNLPLNKFTELLANYCLDNNLLSVLNHCTANLDIAHLIQTNDSLDLRILSNIRSLVPNFDEANLCDNIFYVSRYLSKTSLGQYFCDNPIIFLSLLMFSENLSVITTMKDKSLLIQTVELFGNLEHLMNNFEIFRNIYNNKITELKTTITYYDLTLRHLNVDIKNLYLSGDNESCPNFSSTHLVEKYGYQKKIDYIFFIKECRPSTAYKKFLESQNQDSVIRKTAKLGILNFENATVMAAAIGFSEMAGLDSEFLRVCFKSVKIIKEAGVDGDTVKALFLKVNKEPSVVLDLLESIVLQQIDFENLMLGVNFGEAVKLYEVVFRFSLLFKLPYPEMFLKQCAYLNLWLPFLVYAQLKNYPTTQMKALVPNFKNPNLVEHVVHSVLHDIEDLNVLKGERNSRKYYLSRIGVRHSTDQVHVENLSYSSVSMASSQGSSVDSLEIDVSNVKTTLLQTLIRCHNGTDPPRALLQACQLYKYPFLAIVATCYEPDSVITHWIAWLSVSTDMYEIFTSFDALTMSGSAVTNFLNKCLERRYPKTLLESFVIFIPDNPLRHFTEFLYLIIFKKQETPELKSILDKFLKAKNQRRGSIFSDKDYEMMYIKNKLWIETTSLKLLASAIAFNVDSSFEQEEFLEILCKLDIKNYFDCDTPDFSCLLEILKTISEADVEFDVCKFFDRENYLDSYRKCIDDLTEKGLFEGALKVANRAEINTDSILFKKWKPVLLHDPSRLNECDDDFQSKNVLPDSVVKFYMSLLPTVGNEEEKYPFLKLAYKWTIKLNNNENYHELEKQMILAFLYTTDCDNKINELTEFDEDLHGVTFQEMTQKIDTIETVPGNFSDDVTRKIASLIHSALDKNNFWLALKLEKMFGYKSCDLTILKTCHKLAEKIITPDHLDKEQKSLFLKVSCFRRLSVNSNPPDQTESESLHANFLNSESAASRRQIMSMIHCLVEKLEHGSELGARLWRMYRMSINIDVPYYVIVSETDHVRMLRLALDEDCLNKLEVVHDFIMVFKPSSDQVADLVSGEIIAASSNYVKSKTDSFVMWDLDMNTQFHLVLQLLRNACSTLGHKLYSHASVLYKAQLPNEFDFRLSELALVVEMLVAAHHCFTADCNMDGISMVLKKNRSLISHLLTLRSWKLIVRLFIGTGRFSEMNYVFHILKEHDQFEYLLRKGSRKDDRLKESLLEYIRRFCPDNAQLYKMVALHFTLYSEVAELWEREAEHLMKDLIAIARLEMENEGLNPENEPFVLFLNSVGTEKYLDKILENYSHATEFHMQGEKLTRAMNSVKKGELIALQKSLFKTSANDNNISTTNKAICLLNLSDAQITCLISTKLSFSQSYILVQAYNFMTDWASVIYEQCISQNNSTYLTDYISLLPLNESLVQDISRKFISANINTPKEIQNMKNIVSKMVSVHAKYRIASELGFTDLVEELLDRGQLAYLKDTVWKKGYRAGS